MPSEKTARSSARKQQRNTSLRNKAKTYIKKGRDLIASDDLESAEKAVKDAVVALDKAAQKGAIHRNNAARRKSRIMRTLNGARKL